MSHKSSTARRNAGTGAGIVRCATLQGVDPASPAHPLETRTSTQPSFARYEFCETSGLVSKVARKGELLTDYNKVKINDKLVMETPEQKPGLLLITKN